MKKRNTQSKQMVWDILHQTPHALCHDDIAKQIGDEMDRVTIYRILQSFCQDGLIHKIVDLSGKTFYAPCQNECCTTKHADNHVHFKCLQCEHITCLKQDFSPTLPAQFEFVSFNCIVEGTCPNCR